LTLITGPRVDGRAMPQSPDADAIPSARLPCARRASRGALEISAILSR
jgi:hypothetical protein